MVVFEITIFLQWQNHGITILETIVKPWFTDHGNHGFFSQGIYMFNIKDFLHLYLSLTVNLTADILITFNIVRHHLTV